MGRIPAALQAMVLMALRKEPARRYATAGDLGDDLRRFLAGEAVSARGDSIPYRVRTVLRRRRVGLALLVATVGVAVGIVGTWRGRDGAVPPAVLTPAADAVAIAVLPFQYEGPEGQEYFADGLADVVQGHLAGVPGLTVVSHARALQYRGTDRTPREIGTELGVAYVLEGSARFDRPTEPSGRVVVTPRLVRVADDSTIWTQAFEHTMVQFFSMQSTLARSVVEALSLDTSDVAWSALGAAATPDLEAYRFYLRGNDFLRFNEDESRLRLAETSYLEAVARDSTFAQAWAKLSATHTQLWFHRYDPSDERLELAREAADQALRHHPGLPDSYYALGLFLYQGRGDLRQAQRYFERALELQPNHVNGLFGLGAVLRRQGRMEEALATFERLTVLDPLDPPLPLFGGVHAAADEGLRGLGALVRDRHGRGRGSTDAVCRPGAPGSEPHRIRRGSLEGATTGHRRRGRQRLHTLRRGRSRSHGGPLPRGAAAHGGLEHRRVGFAGSVRTGRVASGLGLSWPRRGRQRPRPGRHRGTAAR